MSRSDKKGEAGDVLSSIRRLVAEETAEYGRRRTVSAAPPPLVLGDALRVRGAESGDVDGDAPGSGPAGDTVAEWPSYAHSRQRKTDPGRSFRELGGGGQDELAEPPAAFEPRPVPVDLRPSRDTEAPAQAQGEDASATEMAEPPLALGADHVAEAPAQGVTAADPVESGFFDEEGLRALVSEVVREELQTALGDELTRKIRRLVKREVLAALELSASVDDPDGPQGV